MTSQSRGAFDAKRMAEQVYALLRLGDHVKYSNTTVALLTERLEAALSEGRRLEREEIALDSLETKYSYAEILQMAAEAIKRIPGKGIVGGGEVTNG